MTDHETYLLLAAKQISEGLTSSEEAELDAHLATCPSCRAFAAQMRRDDILLRGQLGEVAVAPRVRQRVLDEAYGDRRRFDPRIIIALAATLLLATVGIPLIAGGRPPASAPPLPVVTASPSTASPDRSTSTPASPQAPEPSVSLSLPPTPSAGTGPFVAAHYIYNTQVPRRDTIFANLDAGGAATGEWTRTVPAPRGTPYGGPVTCLIIDGNDAWMAGPETVNPDEREAAFIHVHDGGPDGEDDRAILWLNNRGETLTLLEGWCRTKFDPAAPARITSGDIVVDDGAVSPSS